MIYPVLDVADSGVIKTGKVVSAAAKVAVSVDRPKFQAAKTIPRMTVPTIRCRQPCALLLFTCICIWLGVEVTALFKKTHE
jgi:hypothetical protein